MDHRELKMNQLKRLCYISRDTIVLETQQDRITIIGTDLTIKEYQLEEIIISGIFDRVEFTHA